MALQQSVIDTESFVARLSSACRELDLETSDDQLNMLVKYVVLLARWNKTYNLTAIRDPREMLERHIIDSLSVAKYVDDNLVLDVGTGPGLPGIPLAILYPERQFSLLDSNVKKTRFLTQATIELGLHNVEVLHQRIEDLPEARKFPIVISRAFTSAQNFAELCGPCLSEGGKLLAMKGSEAENEAADISADYLCREVIKLFVPGCEAQRQLLIIEKQV